MATFADFVAEQETKPANVKIPPAVQQERDSVRMRILQGEMNSAQARLKAAKTPQDQVAAQQDIDDLNIEMRGSKGVSKPASSGGSFADFVAIADVNAPSVSSTAPKEVESKPSESKVTALIKSLFAPGTTGNLPARLLQSQVQPLVEGATSMIAGSAPLIGLIPGVAAYGVGRLGGKTPEEAGAAGKTIQDAITGRIQSALAPRTEGGQALAGAIVQGAEAAKLPPILGVEAGLAGATTARAGVPKAARPVPAWVEEFRAANPTGQPRVAPGEVPGQPVSGGSVGAAGAQLRTQIEEVASRLPPDEAAKIRSLPPEKVDIDAANRRATAHKFGVELTEGEATQNASKLGDEFNAKKESPEIQRRLDERNTKLFQGIDQIKERSTPDIYTSEPVELGQMIIDDLQAKDALRRQEISGLYKKLEDANAGQLPIDTGQLLANIETELGKKMRTKYAPAELMDTIRDASKRGALTFEEFENLRTIAAEEIRSAKDGNRRYAAGVIRDALENMPLSTTNASIKALADQARAAAKARFDLIDSNPAYKAAVRDSRSAADIQSGLESVSADRFLNDFVTGDTQRASLANVTRLINSFDEGSTAQQALKAGMIEHLRKQASLSGGAFGQHKYNSALSKNKGKLDRLFQGDTVLQDLRDLGELASWTEHKRSTTGANVAESGNVAGAAIRKVVETAANVKTGGIYGKVQAYRANKERQTELRRMVEPGAGISKD